MVQIGSCRFASSERSEGLVYFAQVSGKVTYNGHEMHEFVPQRTCAYISQRDLQMGELTVRETLDFSGRCQGVGPNFGEQICVGIILLGCVIHNLSIQACGITSRSKGCKWRRKLRINHFIRNSIEY